MNKGSVFFLWFVLLVVMACQLGAPAPTSTPDPAELLSGVWVGEWSIEGEGPDGYLYTGEATFDVNSSNEIDGQIVWTLEKSPFEDEQSKIGLSGVEYVRGTFNPQTLEVDFTGYKKDDPDQIIGMDHYKLTLSVDGTRLTGKTENYGDWKGLFIATRKP